VQIEPLLEMLNLDAVGPLPMPLPCLDACALSSGHCTGALRACAGPWRCQSELPRDHLTGLLDGMLQAGGVRGDMAAALPMRIDLQMSDIEPARQRLAAAGAPFQVRCLACMCRRLQVTRVPSPVRMRA
jgi:hypothetical protein